VNLDSTRERRPSHGFGWVDRRVVSGGHLAALPQTEAAVYLLLCVVADRHGISYYQPATLGKLVKHPESRVRGALDTLSSRGLIATAGRLVQVLALELAGPAPAQKALTPVAGGIARQNKPTPTSSPASQPPVEERAEELLMRLPTERRETFVAAARRELAKFCGTRQPSQVVVAALAAGIARQQGAL
jgi:hypothetical protein